MTPPIPAATLVMVRDRPAAPQLLMVERAATLAFAPLALVFPGGRIDPEDHGLGQTMGPDGPAIVAAVRETLEETGVPAAIDPVPSLAVAHALQAELLAGIPFSVLLQRHQLALDPSALTLFARWIPALDLPRRFDTRFFLASAPPGEWTPVAADRENRDAGWLSAADALDSDRAGSGRLLFPTRCVLHRLAQHRSFAAMLDDAGRHPVEPITPSIEQSGDERSLSIPTHLGYPMTRVKLDRQPRH